MKKAFEDRSTWYAAPGHQPGGRVNYIAVGSSSKMNLGDDYYAQNFYDIHTWKTCLQKGKFPISQVIINHFNDQLEYNLILGINNLLDSDPPINGNIGYVPGNANTFPSFYDPLGRYLFLKISKKIN